MTEQIGTWKFFVLTALAAFLIFSGCDDSAPRGQIDETVKELSGQKSVERMARMKEDIAKIQDRQADRLKQLDAEEE